MQRERPPGVRDGELRNGKKQGVWIGDGALSGECEVRGGSYVNGTFEHWSYDGKVVSSRAVPVKHHRVRYLTVTSSNNVYVASAFE